MKKESRIKMKFEEMYFHLMHECEKARRLVEQAEQVMIKAQQECEEMYCQEHEEDKAI